MGRSKRVIINNYASKTKKEKNKIYLIEKEDKNPIGGLIVASIAYIFTSFISLVSVMGEYLDEHHDHSFSTIIDSMMNLPAKEVFPFLIKLAGIIPVLIALFIAFYIAINRAKEEDK